MMSDSINVLSPGRTISESNIREAIVKRAEGHKAGGSFSQSRQSIPLRQRQSANDVNPSRHVSDSQPMTSINPATSATVSQ